MKTEAKVKVKVWQCSQILLEKYCYSSGLIEPLPKHSHEEYQLGMCLDRQGEYFYRGVYHSIPIGKLSVISSEVVHRPSDVTYLSRSATYLMMQIAPDLLRNTVSEIAQKPISYPFFDIPVLNDAAIASMYRYLCTAMATNSTQLAIDDAVENLLARLVVRHARESPTLSDLKSTPKAIAIVRDFIRVHYADSISLDRLSKLAGLSRSYLCRLFQQEVGISLSAYQMQFRINAAKKLIAQGTAIATVATLTGFYDQSHFGVYFKRLVGTTPGNYRNRTITS